MFYRIVTLIRKELQALLRDPQSRRLLILPVLMQLILFPNAATLEVKNNTLAIFNEDTGAPSIELMQRFAQAEAFSTVIPVHDRSALRRVIDRQEALLALRFPPDFSAKLATGRDPELQAILDGRRSNSGQIALGYVQQILEEWQAERAPAGNEGHSEIIVRHWFNPNLQYVWFIVPTLVAIITTVSTMIVTSLSVAREREQGTFDQLLVSPLTPGMIMLGKAAPALLVSIVQGTVILLGGVFAYGIPFRGSLLFLYGSMVFYITALCGFGLLISSICATQQQAFLGVFSFMMPAVLLSGFASPIDNMPQWLQTLNWINPLPHFIAIVKGLFLKDIPLSVVLSNLWPLLVIAAVTLTGANLVFRRRLG